MAPNRRLAVARTFVAATDLDDVAAGAADVALGVLLVVAGFSPVGALLSSSARIRIANPSIALPLLAVTFWVTLVEVTLMILPTGLFLIPLSINSCTPGATAGMVKLLLNFEVLMREDAHFGGVTVVFCALRP